MMADPKQDVQAIEEMRDKAYRFALLASGTARNQLALDKAEGLAHSATILAGDARERSEALEALGRVCLLDFKGMNHGRPLPRQSTFAWPRTRRLRPTSCGCARSPWRSPRGPVEPYFEIAIARLGDKESEESARIRALRSYWPWMFREGPEDPQAIERAREAGERAADVAIKLGQGLYGRMGLVLERRLSFVPGIQDPWELGDVFATAAWEEFCTGRYGRAGPWPRRGSTALGVELWGRPALPGLASPGPMSAGRLAGVLCGGRAHRRVAGRPERSAPGVRLRPLRGRGAGTRDPGRLGLGRPAAPGTAVARADQGRPSPVWMAWVSMLLARRGAFADARAMFRRIEAAPGPGRGPRLEAWCDVVCEEEAWDELGEAVTESRLHAEEAALLGLPFYADRAEGRAALAAGDARSAGRDPVPPEGRPHPPGQEPVGGGLLRTEPGPVAAQGRAKRGSSRLGRHDRGGTSDLRGSRLARDPLARSIEAPTDLPVGCETRTRPVTTLFGTVCLLCC